MPMEQREMACFRLAIFMTLVCVTVSGFCLNPYVSSRQVSISSSSSTGVAFAAVATTSNGTASVVPHFHPKSSSVTTNQTPNKKHKPSKQFEEFQWLNWVYKQWRPTKPGDLSDEVLKQMVPAINRWGRRRSLNAANRAEELLERIIEENLAGNPNAEVSVSLFNQAMDAYAKIGNPEGVQRILRRMKDVRSEYTHLAHLKPDVISMSTLATAWGKSRSPDAASQADAILKYMKSQNLRPNTITYNALLHALAMGKDLDTPIRAEDLLREMKERHAAGDDCAPDIYSYQFLIQAWSRTLLPGAPQKAEQILRYMDREAEKQGNDGIAPNAYCFTNAMYAWARSSEKSRARNAYNLLNHMRKRYMENHNKGLKPNVIAYTAVLNACALPIHESESEEAFEIAQLAMAELSLGTCGKPNFLSYAAFLSVCATTLEYGERRDAAVRSIFKQCVEAGEVAHIVLDKLKVAASPSLYIELVGGFRRGHGELRIPPQWSRNIKGERIGDKIISASKSSPLSRQAKMRLKAAQRLKGKSGFYSSGKVQRLESEGISWSKQETFGTNEEC